MEGFKKIIIEVCLLVYLKKISYIKKTIQNEKKILKLKIEKTLESFSFFFIKKFILV